MRILNNFFFFFFFLLQGNIGENYTFATGSLEIHSFNTCALHAAAMAVIARGS